jgi:hypothetical protein
VARIQILELPAGPGDERPPFALVIDEHEPQRYILGFEPSESPWDKLAEQLGACAILYFPETVDIPANGVDLPAAVLVGGDSEALTEMTRSRDEWMQRSIATRESLTRVRDRNEQRKAELTDALGLDRLRDWDDVLNAARGIRRERQAQRDAIQAAYRLHCPDSYQGQEICTHCSLIDDTGSTTTRYMLYPCATIKALTAAPEPETRPEAPAPTP